MSALIGTWSAAESSGSITLAARTTTSGSLITVAAGGWVSSGSTSLPICTDAHSNTYVEPAGDLDCDSGTPNARITLQYNAGAGTRGSGHTITNAFTGFASNALGAHEWSGVETSPTVVSGTNTGTSTTPSGSVSVGAASLVVSTIGISTDTTITASGGASLAQDVDTDNSNQEHTTLYKIGQTGTPSVGADLGASTGWGVITIAFTELVVSVALTGTALATINEADIVAGSKTIVATVTNDTFVPASEISDITFVANALGATNSTTSFSITLPTTQTDDILILEFAHRGTGDGTIGGTSITTGGLTWTLKHSQLFGSSAFSGKTYWTRATGNHGGQTVTGASLTNSCAAILTQYRGAATSGDPLSDATIVGEENASGDETQAEITTATNKAWVVLVVVNSPDLAVSTQSSTSPGTLTERAERLSTGGTDSSIAHASAEKVTAGATGALTWAQTNAASGSWAYAIKPVVTIPFADARAAIRDGLDSAQSESGGWDAKVKPNIPVGNIVRTSDTVVTITLQAQSDYNITAQETITATLPGTALANGIGVAATPTFTIDTSSGGTVEEADGAASGSTLSAIGGVAIFSGITDASGIAAASVGGVGIFAGTSNAGGVTTSTAVGAGFNLSVVESIGSTTPLTAGASVWTSLASANGLTSLAADGEDAGGNIEEADGLAEGIAAATTITAAIWAPTGTSAGSAASDVISNWIHGVAGNTESSSLDSILASALSLGTASSSDTSTCFGEAAFILQADFLSEVVGNGGLNIVIIND